MTSAHDAKAREIAERHGLICLVGHGVTSHEHTLCDCKVLEVIATALRDCERETLERAAKAVEAYFEEYDIRTIVGELPSRIRALAQEEPKP